MSTSVSIDPTVYLSLHLATVQMSLTESPFLIPVENSSCLITHSPRTLFHFPSYCLSLLTLYRLTPASFLLQRRQWHPLQYSCLENPMDRGAWKAAVHGIVEGWTRLSDFTFTFHFHALEKEMATHSSVLAWRIPGTGSLVSCRLWGRTESDTTEVT